MADGKVTGVLALPTTLVELAETQFGLVTDRQVLAAVSAHQARRLKAAGVLLPTVDRGVHRLAGAGRTFRQRACGLCLNRPHLVISHLAAARLHQAETAAAPLLEVTVRDSQRHGPVGRPEVITHRCRLPAFDVVERWGIPVTSPCRTVLDLSSRTDPAALQRIYDDLQRNKRLRAEQLGRRLDRGGLPRFDHAAIDRLLGRRAGASVREDWVYDTIVNAGLPAPRRNVIVEVGGCLRELDCAYLEERIAIEYDSVQVHTDLTHFFRDRERVSELQLHGWLVLLVTMEWTREQLVHRTRQALEARGQPA